MCQSQNSSAIYKELQDEELYTEEERQFVVDTSHWGDFSDYTQPWFDDPELPLQQSKNGCLMSIGYTSPAVSPLLYSECIGSSTSVSTRNSKDIDLVFNSNMTNIQPRFLETIGQFRDVLMCLSVDGYAQYNDYIRSGSTWSVIDKHIRDYADSEVVGNILFSPVIQIYNILNITDLLDYAEEISNESGRRIDISFLLNNYPKCLDIRNLPQNVRDVAIQQLETWSATSKYFDADERNKQTVLGLIKALKESYNEDSEEQMQVFKEYTLLLDSKREQSMKESIPELWELLGWT